MIRIKYIYIGLVVLLLLCLLPMPYGFYILVRFVAMCAFVVLAYIKFRDKAEKYALIYAALALLFQPFLKITLGKDVWQVVDVVVAIFLLWQLYTSRKANSIK